MRVAAAQLSSHHHVMQLVTTCTTLVKAILRYFAIEINICSSTKIPDFILSCGMQALLEETSQIDR